MLFFVVVLWFKICLTDIYYVIALLGSRVIYEEEEFFSGGGRVQAGIGLVKYRGGFLLRSGFATLCQVRSNHKKS